MRLLLFSDLHCDAAAARAIVARSQTVDVVVGAGDFASVRRGLHTCLEILREIERPAVLVPGNNESLDELVAACRSWPDARVLHGGATTIQDVTFFGLGGGVPQTPFGAWSFDLSESDAEGILERCPEGSVLVSHSPPKEAVDRASDGRRLGSVAVRRAVLRCRPRLVVCGHIHASAGQQALIGVTPVVNAGPAGLEWEI